MNSGVLLVIPARYDSVRFPGKALADLHGKPMIQHVWEGAIAAKVPEKVIVATDDDRISRCVRNFGGEVCVTSQSHRNGTERVAEVATQFDYPIVVNLQGDLPLFRSKVLDDLIEKSRAWITGGKADLVTAKSEITSKNAVFSPDTVKIVCSTNGTALYFSRSTIPYLEENGFEKRGLDHKYYQHYGIYCYDRAFLLKIVNAPEGSLEHMERLEQLRVLEQGGRIGVVEIDAEAAQSFWEVNRPEDLKNAEAILASGLS
ncbi:MAG: 3-deoxy-manno-octulosonate cytidylyltransferase [Nitrospiria bacterium]